MNSAKPFLSVIIPAYNEERRIASTLNAIYAYLTKQAYRWEILVVIDGAQDDTLGVIQAFAAGKERVRWLHRQENRGKGYTVREGILAARGQIRLFTDADNSTDISHIERMHPLFEAGYEVVLCSRDPKDVAGAAQTVQQPFLKRQFGNLGNLFIQIVAARGIWDTQCGFKAFTAQAAQEIFSLARLEGWAFDVEAIFLARQLGYKTGVVPAQWKNQPGTHVQFWDYFNVLMDTLRIRYYFQVGLYGDFTREPYTSDKQITQ
jgi:dolichyl-phosphate beta-glucosyltransferase